MKILWSGLLMLGTSLLLGCSESKPPPNTNQGVPKHEHVPMHGGTVVALGEEEYHVEFVLDAGSGKMQAYIFDGHLENFVRLAAPSFEVSARWPDRTESLTFSAVANNATGESVGDTAQFETQAEWLKTVKSFEAVLKAITIKGKSYQTVGFNFPRGNERDTESSKK